MVAAGALALRMVIAAISGMGAATICHPLDVIRVQMQTDVGGEYKSPVDCAQKNRQQGRYPKRIVRRNRSRLFAPMFVRELSHRDLCLFVGTSPNQQHQGGTGQERHSVRSEASHGDDFGRDWFLRRDTL